MAEGQIPPNGAGKGFEFSALSSSITIRACLIFGLALAMLVPLVLVGRLVDERSDRRTEAIAEIANSWGGWQTVVGPLLVVPFQEVIRSEDGPQTSLHHAVFLPEELSVTGDLPVQTRARGIYEAQLYSTELNLEGAFTAPDFSQFPLAEETERTILWDQAVLTVMLSDQSGISATPEARWDRAPITFKPGPSAPGLSNGMHAALSGVGPNGTAADFSIRLAFNGSSGMAVVPVGSTTNVSLTSNWPHPSFGGAVLPVARDITNDGFTADWSVSSLARAYPQAWIAGNSTGIGFYESAVSVGLITPVDVYTQTDRAVKYGILFIGLTFLAVFLVELKSGRAAHIIQYGLIGAALSIFYLLLLSLSEHIGFLPAYLAGGLAVLLAIGWYSIGALGSVARAALVSAILAGLYVVLFVLLSLVDYALLVGSLVVFIALVVAMAATRNLRDSEKPEVAALAASQPSN